MTRYDFEFRCIDCERGLYQENNGPSEKRMITRTNKRLQALWVELFGRDEMDGQG